MNIRLEWDAVTLAPDMATSVAKAIKAIRGMKKDTRDNTNAIVKQQEELLLAYVACSRAKVSLTGATFLPRGYV